jgi:hypothetical protein
LAPAVADGSLLVATFPSSIASTQQPSFVGLVAVDPISGQQTLFTTGSSFTLPTYITEDLSSGTLYVTDLQAFTTGAVFSVNPSGTVNLVSTHSSINGPNVLILFGGFLYVANAGQSTGRVDNILKIDPSTGQQLGIISNGDNGTSTGSNTATTLNDTSGLDLSDIGNPSPTMDPRKPWATNEWAGWSVKILSGTGAGQVRTVTSNTSTQLTISSPWSTIPDTTSTYEIGFSVPTGIAPGPGNTVYVADEPGNYQGLDLGSVWQVNLTTGVQTLLYTGGDFDHPVDVALNGNYLLVVNTGNPKDNVTGSLFEINTQTGQQSWIVQGPHQDGSPGGGQGFGSYSGTDSLELSESGTICIGEIAAGSTPAKLLAVDPATGTYTTLTSDNNLSSVEGMRLYHTPALIQTTTTVTASVNPSVSGQGVTFTAVVSPISGSGTPTGTVQFMIDGTSFGTPVSLANGVATSIATTILSVANHTIQASYSGDSNFAASTGSFTQTVGKASTSTALSPSLTSSVFGQSVTFTATVSVQTPGSTAVANPTGTVTFLDGSSNIGQGTLTTNNGVTTAVLTVSSLTAATHTITASYGGDGNFLSSNRVLTITVNKASTSTVLSSSANPSFTGQSVTFTATVGVLPPGAGTPTGTVQFTIDNNNAGTANVTTSGGVSTAIFSPSSPLAQGTHIVTATYSGDVDFASSPATALTQTVSPMPATKTVVSSSLDPSVFGQSVTFTATVTPSGGSGTPTGTVQFMIDNQTIGSPVNLSSGVASSGAVSNLSVNNHIIQAVYSGDSTFAGSSGTLMGGQTVGKAATSTALSAASTSSVYGQNVSFTATVSVTAPGAGTPTGSVQFTIDGTNSGSPVNVSSSGGRITATYSLASLAVGTHTVTASYSGDGNFTTSTATALTQTVATASTNTVVTSTANPSVTGQSVTLTATIGVTAPGAGTPTGTVQFVVDGTPNNPVSVNTTAGVTTASLSIASLGVGTHAVMASYSGDGNFAGSGDPFTQTVNKANTSTALNASFNPSVVNQSVTFTATVSVVAPGGGMPTGTVQFMIDNQSFGSPVTLTGGLATSGSISSLSVTNHIVQAVYSGDLSFATSTGMLTQSVTKATTNTSVSSSANPSLPGQQVTFTATVSVNAPGTGTPTGTVQFVIDNNTNTNPVNVVTTGGVTTATFSTASLASGTHTVTATYSGDSNFLTSSGTLAGGQTVTSKTATNTVVSSSLVASVFGQSVTFTATVTPSNGSGTPTGTVQFMIDNQAFGSPVTLSSGVASSSSISSLAVNNHTIQAVYSGDIMFAGSSGTLTQTVGKAATSTAISAASTSSAYGQNVTFTTTVSVTAPGAGTPTGSVQFAIDGTNQGSPVSVTTTGGVTTASYTIGNLAVGTHTVTASYTGDTSFSGSSATPLTQTVSQANTSTAVVASVNPSAVGQTVTFTATISASGQGSAPTGTVQWLVDNSKQGSPVPVSTSGGVTTATLSLATLSAGTHTITASYSGDSNYLISSGNLTQTVTPAPTGTSTTTTVSSSANPQTAGQPVSWTATVAAATGAVNFVNFETGDFSQTASHVGGSIVTSPALSGTYSLQLQRNNSVANVEIRQSGTTYYNLPTAYYRFLFEYTSNPGEGGIVNFQDTASGFKAALHLSSTGKLLFYDSSGNLIATGTTTLVSGQVYAISAMIGTGSTAAWQIEINGTVEMSGSGNLGSNNNGSLKLGGNGAYTATYYYDDVAINSQAYPGPVPTGTVQFLVDGTASGSPVPLSDGTATSTPTSSLAAGTYTVTASYSGDNTYAASTGMLTGGQTIKGQPATSSTTATSSANPVVYGQTVTFTATVAASGSGTPTGTVTFFDGSTSLGQGTLSGSAGSSTATFSTASLSAGTHTITASYSGDSTFAGSSGSFTQTVSQANTSTALVASVNPSAVGQTVTFTATISASGQGSAPTGTVQWLVDNTKQGSPVPVSTSGGVTTATLSLATLSSGTHTITASYSGDTNYLTSSGSLTQTVTAAPGIITTTTVSSSANPQATGQPVSWTATVTANGSVNFVNFESGDFSQTASHVGGTIVTSPALSGTYSLELQRSGSVANAEIRQSGATYYNLPTAYYRFLFEYTSNPGEGGIVNFQDTSSGFKAALHLSSTGKLLFYDSSGNLIATGTTTLVSGQVYAISAMIGTGSTAAWQIEINGTVEMSGSGNLGSNNNGSLKLGGNGAYTATYYYDDVAINSQAYPGPVPTGTVQFLVDGTASGSPVPLSDGTATSTPTSSLAAGTYTVTASYSGDNTYAASTGMLTGGQTIKGQPATSSTTATSSANPVVYGQTVTFTATVAASGSGTPTGTVTFFDGSTSLGQGTLSGSAGSSTATFSTASLSAGTHTITASYSGDSTFAGSSGSFTQTVSQANTSTALVASVNPSAVGQTVTFTATISASGQGSAPTGTVQWLVDNTKQGSPVPVSTSGGVTTATLSLATLSSGTHTITASYSGDTNYLTSSGSLTQTVTASIGTSTTTTVSSSANPQTAGQPVSWTATVTANGSVNFVNFETGDFSQTASHVGGTIVTSPALSGTYSLQLQRNNSVANVEIRQSGTTYYNLPTAYYRFLFEYTSNPGEGGIVNFQDTSSGFKAALHLSSTDKLLFYDSTGTLLATGTTNLVSGQVYAISAMIGTGSTAAWQIEINGAVEMSGSGNLGSNNNGSLKLGGNGAYTATYYYDDVAINSQAYPGPVPTGTVQFIVDNSPSGSPVPLSDGTATSTPTSSLAAGTYTVTASYSGDNTYAASTGTLSGGQTISSPGSGIPNGTLLVLSSPLSGQTSAPDGIIGVNPSTGAQFVVASGGQFGLPAYIREGPNQQLYVADYSATGSGAVIGVDPNTGQQSIVAKGGYINAPVALTIINGILYVADEGGSSPNLVAINLSTDQEQLVSSGGSFSTPVALAPAPNGNIYWADEYAFGGVGAIFLVNVQTGTQTVVTQGGNLDHMLDMGLDASGNLIAVNAGSGNGGSIIRINPQNGAQTIVSSGGSLTGQLDGGVVDTTHGIIYVSSIGSGSLPSRILAVNLTNGAQSTVSSGQNLSLVADMAIFSQTGAGAAALPATSGPLTNQMSALLVNQTQASESQPAPRGTAASAASSAAQPHTQEILFASQSTATSGAGQSSGATTSPSATDQPTIAKDAVDSLFAGWDGSLNGGSLG